MDDRADGRTWLQHPETGGTFHCPDAAVDGWIEMGWEPGDAPEEVNPAIADRLAQERQLAEQAAKDDKPARPAKKAAGAPAKSEEK